MTLDMISTKTGREQAEVFMRQYARRMEGEIRQRVLAEVATWQAHIDELLEQADRTIKSREGFLKKVTFNKIRMALHPDTYRNLSMEQRNAATQAWEELKTVLLAEEDSPTPPHVSMEEMMRRREEVRRANSASGARRRTRRPRPSGPGGTRADTDARQRRS